MCGLVGMIGFLEHKHKSAMRELFFLNSLRGKDSTGLSVIDRDRQVLTRKLTVPGYEFIEYPVVDRIMSHADQVWMGHGRFRTTGAVSRANAHPFEVLDNNSDVMLVGTHNGTLQNKWEVEKALKEDRYDTDSEALFNWLVEAPNYKEAIAALRGAWSLVWWDATNDSVHFLRNKERPLTFAWTKDRKVLVYASEAWMIINSCRRNGVELEVNDKGMACYSTLEDHLYTLEIPQERNKPLPDLIREGGYVGAPATTFQQKFKPNSWWGERDEQEEGKKKTAASQKGDKTNSATDKKKTTYKVGGIRGYDGVYISTAEFDAIWRKGCAWCKKEMQQGHAYAFLDEDSLVCTRCMRDTHPKDGGSLRPGCSDADTLDDDVPSFDQKNTDEYRDLIAQAVAGAI